MAPTARESRRWAAAYRRGATFRQVAERFGVDEWVVRRALAGLVDPRRTGPEGRPEITAEQVVGTFEAIGSMRGTARHLGCSLTLVQARLHEAGLIEHHPDQRPRKPQD